MQNLKGLLKVQIASAKDVKIATTPLDMHAHKYSRGSVLIIGASFIWKGAMTMAAYAANNALAALRTASGFVTIAGPREVIARASFKSPAFVLAELNGNMNHDFKVITSAKHSAVVIGPGIQQENINKRILPKIIDFEKAKGNAIIIDAAVIRYIARNKKLISSNMVITPHFNEFKVLSGIDLKNAGLAERVKVSKRFAKIHKCILVLKGHETIVTDGRRLKVNLAKTPALATMGTGDVLCGIIASYAASHNDLFESAVAGVHVHSLIGDVLYEKKGAHIIATDVIDEIPKVIKPFDRKLK